MLAAHQCCYLWHPPRCKLSFQGRWLRQGREDPWNLGSLANAHVFLASRSLTIPTSLANCGVAVWQSPMRFLILAEPVAASSIPHERCLNTGKLLAKAFRRAQNLTLVALYSPCAHGSCRASWSPGAGAATRIIRWKRLSRIDDPVPHAISLRSEGGFLAAQRDQRSFSRRRSVLRIGALGSASGHSAWHPGIRG
jgi:hypothetical protein